MRYYTSSMTGAPVLSGNAGALIAVLDACLVDGFGNRVIDSLVVTGGIATANISSGHDFAEGDVLRISGATPAGLNSDWRLASTTANSVTWSVEGCGVADGIAQGAIVALRAPAGWGKVFSDGATRAVYRSLQHADHNGMFLYVNDTTTTTSRVVGCEMSNSIDIRTGLFPTETQLSGGGFWAKSTLTDTTPRSWCLVADSLRFGYFPQPAGSTGGLKQFFFGKLTDSLPTDVWNTAISYAKTSANALSGSPNTTSGDLVYTNVSTTSQVIALVRSINGDNGSQIANPASLAPISGDITGSSSLPQHAFFSGDIGLSRVFVFQINSEGRGTLPMISPSCYRILSSSAPIFSKKGVTGSGVVLGYCGATSSSFSYFISLGENGRWD